MRQNGGSRAAAAKKPSIVGSDEKQKIGLSNAAVRERRFLSIKTKQENDDIFRMTRE